MNVYLLEANCKQNKHVPLHLSTISWSQLLRNSPLPIANIDVSTSTSVIRIEPWNIIFSGTSGTGPDWTGTLSSLNFTWQDGSSNPDNDIGYVLAGKKYSAATGSGNKGQIIIYNSNPDVTPTPTYTNTYNIVSYRSVTPTSSLTEWEVGLDRVWDSATKGSGYSGNQFYIDFKVDSANL